MSRDEFAVALQSALVRLGIDQKDAAERSGESVTRINDWLKKRRPASPEKQAAVLASLERETRRVEDVIAQAEADVIRRMRQLASDLATIFGATAPAGSLSGSLTTADYEEALDVGLAALQPPSTATPRPARRRSK